MKIGLDVSQIVYDTGVSRYTKELVKSLLKEDKKNEYILFASTLRQGAKIKKFEEELKEFQNFSIKQIKIPISFLEVLWNRLHVFPIENFIGQVDIFHTSDWLEPPTKLAKKVTTIHDLIIYLFPKSFPEKIVNNHKRKLNFVKKETSIVIADSQTTADDAEKFLGIPREKIKVAPLAPATNFKMQEEEKINEVLTKYKIKKPYILSVATREPRKNIEILIEVFEKLKKESPDLNLVLTGKFGWGAEIPKESGITSTGFVQDEDLPAIYCGCHVFAYPSLYEGFGLPVLEAMACGAPVITSNNSSMMEIAKDAAILVDPRNKSQIEKALRLVLNLPKDDYQKMVRASLDRARKYSWAKTAKQTLSIYKEVYSANSA